MKITGKHNFLFLLSVLFLLHGCNKKQHGHFNNKQNRYDRINKIPPQKKINDCEVMEEKREKQEKQNVIKAKKKVKKDKKLKKKGYAKNAKIDVGRRSIKDSKISFVVIIALALLLALGAIAFVIFSVVFILVSFAFSLLLIPFIISIASLVITSIAFVFLQLFKSLQKNRRRRREKKLLEEEEKREQERKQQQNQEGEKQED